MRVCVYHVSCLTLNFSTICCRCTHTAAVSDIQTADLCDVLLPLKLIQELLCLNNNILFLFILPFLIVRVCAQLSCVSKNVFG